MYVCLLANATLGELVSDSFSSLTQAWLLANTTLVELRSD